MRSNKTVPRVPGCKDPSIIPLHNLQLMRGEIRSSLPMDQQLHRNKQPWAFPYVYNSSGYKHKHPFGNDPFELHANASGAEPSRPERQPSDSVHSFPRKLGVIHVGPQIHHSDLHHLPSHHCILFLSHQPNVIHSGQDLPQEPHY